MYKLGDWINISRELRWIARGSETTGGKLVANGLIMGNTLFFNVHLSINAEAHVPEDDAGWVIWFPEHLRQAMAAKVVGITPLANVTITDGRTIHEGTAIATLDGIKPYIDGLKVTAKHPFPEGTHFWINITGFWEIEGENND